MSLPEKNRTYLIIRLSSFGDVLLASSTAKSIKHIDPNAKIHFVVKKLFSVMIENNPYIDYIFFYEEFKPKTQNIRYDFIVDLQNNARSSRIVKALNYFHYVTYEKHRISRFFHVYFNYQGFNQPIESVPQKYLNSLKTLIPNIELSKPEFYISDANFYQTIDLKSNAYFVFAPGAAHFTKQWPVAYYSDLISACFKKYPTAKCVLLGGPAETDTAQHLVDTHSEIINLVGKTTFDQSASIINQALAVICNDSSLMHLAAALDKKVLTFFGSTSEVFGFYPYTTTYKVLEIPDLKCRPCSHIGRKSCPKSHFRCMKDITPENAFEALSSLVGDAS